MKVAELSTCRQRHGAVVVKGGRVLALGLNSMRNDPKSAEPCETKLEYLSEHAELAALRRVKNPEGITLYVSRISRDGKPALSRPCQNCAEALRLAKVKAVCYTV